MSVTKESFLKDVSNHVIEIIRNDGISRHIRLRKPGTMSYHFDLITWPGYLCYTGDMGTYVFRRLEDMFTFFRKGNDYRDEDPMTHIDHRYWAEKLEATDKGDGFQQFDKAAFKREITQQRRRLLVEYTREWDTEDRQSLWDELEDVKNAGDDDEHRAFAAVWDFSFRYRQKCIQLSTDDFPRCKQYTHRFLWCCYALRWGINKYDESTKAT